MRNKRIVIALGGNALGSTPAQQLELAEGAAKSIADLIEAGCEITITHGNGPQIGMINASMNSSADKGSLSAEMPFPECGAMSQGYIGYHLQNSIVNELAARKISRDVATIITQVLIDKNDPAFLNPTKPIGSFYTKEQAQQLTEKMGYCMKPDSDRGYRRVVPSPAPIDIVEKNTIKLLLDKGNIVISTGGGGIPVIKDGFKYVGVSAVIDKDLAAAKIAKLIDADLLVILTAVDNVAVNFKKPNQRLLTQVDTEQAKRYCNEGQFAPGSMLPKVLAAIEFAETGKTAVIASLANASDAIYGRSGTVFTSSSPEASAELEELCG